MTCDVDATITLKLTLKEAEAIRDTIGKTSFSSRQKWNLADSENDVLGDVYSAINDRLLAIFNR
mgnify:CR=1 FL=1